MNEFTHHAGTAEFRPGSSLAGPGVTIAPYLASLLCILVVLAFRGTAVEDGAKGIEMISFSAIHLALMSYAHFKGMNQTVSLSHAVLMVALPFVSLPYEAFIWVVYFIPVIHHAIIYRNNILYSFVFLALPWLAFAVHSFVFPSTSVGMGSVLFVSLLAGAMHYWFSGVMDMFDRQIDQNETLRLQQALRKERERISTDLHDGLGAGLTGLGLRCRVAARLLAQDPEKTVRFLSEIEHSAQSSLQQMRLSMQSLLQKTLPMEEFSRSLRQVCTQAGSDSVTLDIQDHSCPNISPSLAYHLLLFAAEAINNAVRHGQARQIHVQFVCGGTDWSLVVEDDGKGLGENQSLRTLEKRARMLEARITVASRPGEGTKLSLLAGHPPLALNHP